MNKLLEATAEEVKALSNIQDRLNRAAESVKLSISIDKDQFLIEHESWFMTVRCDTLAQVEAFIDGFGAGVDYATRDELPF